MIGIFYGTRPEYIKLQPIIKELKEKEIPHISIKVLQHTTLISSVPYDLVLSVPCLSNNRLTDILSIFTDNEEELSNLSLTKVVVQGDTATAFGAALWAFNHQIPIYHVEAGLRTYGKNPYPEEAYRKMISDMASYHFCPTFKDGTNLSKERVIEHIYITGNTIIDALNQMPSKTILNPLSKQTIVCTLHRRENKETLPLWIEAINSLANKYPTYDFVVFTHPSSFNKKFIEKYKYLDFKNPISHIALMDLLENNTIAVITDSGGLQEEANYFGITTFVCREATERPCTTSILVKDPLNLINKFYIPESTKSYKGEFGDGNAAKKIVEVLVK